MWFEQAKMERPLFALLVHDRRQSLESSNLALKHISVETFSVRTCEDLQRLVPQTQPHLIFTDTFLPDGTWVDVINLAEKAAAPINVIVVGTNPDVRLCLSVLERGAFDFILPPFEPAGLNSVVRSAGYDACHRRQAMALAAVSDGTLA